MKSIITTAVLISLSAPSFAGPFANIESNAGWTGNSFSTSVTEVHGGYQFDNGFYFQGGPAFLSNDGTQGSREYSGKVGYSGELNQDLTVYGEVSAITVDQEFEFNDMNIGTKVGLTYTF